MEGNTYDDCVVVAQPPYRGFEVTDSLKEIPYRSFLPNEVKGLLVAGRCLSGDFGAVEMLRVIPTVMLMGQACGAAAAQAVKDSVELDEIDVEKNCREHSLSKVCSCRNKGRSKKNARF